MNIELFTLLLPPADLALLIEAEKRGMFPKQRRREVMDYILTQRLDSLFSYAPWLSLVGGHVW